MPLLWCLDHFQENPSLSGIFSGYLSNFSEYRVECNQGIWLPVWKFQQTNNFEVKWGRKRHWTFFHFFLLLLSFLSIFLTAESVSKLSIQQCNIFRYKKGDKTKTNKQERLYLRCRKNFIFLKRCLLLVVL